MKTGSKLKPHKLLLAAQKPTKTHNQNCLIRKSKSKQKPNKQGFSQVAVLNRSLQNPKPPPFPNPNPKKGGEFPKLK
jgi:hypothetical protein